MQPASNQLVTVVTATTGNPLLEDCLRSVKAQTHKNIQHLVVADGPTRWNLVRDIVGTVNRQTQEGYRGDVIYLPYSIGKDRWNGHRIYGSSTYMADGDFIMYLDDDNSIDPTHVEECLATINAMNVYSGKNNSWAYTLRKLRDANKKLIGYDNCESLGKWASVLDPNDFFVDVNCYFLPRLLAVQISPLWFRKFREPGQPEVDRVLCHALRQIAPNYECTYKYSVNYTVGNTTNSVQLDFFARGNEEMMRRYNGVLPWVK